MGLKLYGSITRAAELLLQTAILIRDSTLSVFLRVRDLKNSSPDATSDLGVVKVRVRKL